MNKNLIIKAIFFIFITICSIRLFGQKEVKNYYNHVNKAELAICSKNYELAAKHYHKAFETEIMFSRDLNNSFIVNYKYTDNENRAIQDAWILAQRGLKYQSLIDDTIKYADLYAQLKVIFDTTTTTIIPELAKILDSLKKEDQAIRKYCVAYNDTCVDQVKRIDSLNLLTIKRLYEKYGSINEINSGPKGMFNLFLILLHNTQWKQHPKDVAYQNMLSGLFDARKYAELEDRYTTSIMKQKSRFRFGDASNSYIIHKTLFLVVPKDVKQVNKNRKQIFLEQFSDTEKKQIFIFNNRDSEFSIASRYVIDYGSKEENIKNETAEQEKFKNVSKKNKKRYKYYISEDSGVTQCTRNSCH